MVESVPPPGSPEFSVVIPSRDRPGPLQRCLVAISQLETPRNQFEVIVVDDGSREPYGGILERYAATIRLRGLRQEGVGPGLARNAGAAIARGRFVALTDDDCEPAPDWLTRLGESLRHRPDALVGGRTINVLKHNLCSEASQVLISYLYAYYHGGEREPRFFTSCNFAMSAELFRQSGGFHSDFRLAGGEDRDFCDRWSASGRPMLYIPGVVVHHAHSLTLAGFLRQHYTYGRGAWFFHRARAERGRGRVAVEPLSFLAGMLAHPFREEHVRWPLAVSVLIGCTVVMNALGYFRERFRAASTSMRG